MNIMTTRYRLVSRRIRGGRFYCVDKLSGKRTSHQTTSKDEARQNVEAKNQAERQPVLNLQIAKAYLAGTDNGTRQEALDALIGTKLGSNQHRWQTAAKDKAFAPLLRGYSSKLPVTCCYGYCRPGRSPRMFTCAGCTTSAWT